MDEIFVVVQSITRKAAGNFFNAYLMVTLCEQNIIMCKKHSWVDCCKKKWVTLLIGSRFLYPRRSSKTTVRFRTAALNGAKYPTVRIPIKCFSLDPAFDCQQRRTQELSIINILSIVKSVLRPLTALLVRVSHAELPSSFLENPSFHMFCNWVS